MNRKYATLHRHIIVTICAGLTFVLGSGPTLGSTQAKSKRHNSVRRVPSGTELKIRLHDTIDSKEVRSGDHFKATVVNPTKYEQSTVDGHLSSVKKSGNFTGRTSINMVFDRIIYRDGTVAPLHGQVIRVYGEESVSKVDEEGNIESGKRGSQTAKRTGGGAAGGAILGGIIGGGKGAAIGASVGAAAGAGSLMIAGSKRLTLERGTELLVRVTAR